MQKQKLSKSSFMLGTQCLKAIYLKYNQPELMTPLSFEQQSVINSGIEVGMVGRQLYPGGVDLSQRGTVQFPELISATAGALGKANSVFYEAGFSTPDHSLRFQADLFVVEKKMTKLIEVKSSTSVKSEHILDIAFQWNVLKKSGYSHPVRAYIAYINSDYVLDESLDVHRLFVVEDVTERVISSQALIESFLASIDNTLNLLSAPPINISESCFKPYACRFFEHCWEKIPNTSVFDLGGIRKKKAFELYNNGIILHSDIPRNIKLSDKQWIEVSATISGTPHINHEEIKNFLQEIEGPAFYMDFETTLSPIPKLYKGSRPYQQTCIQYCVIEKPSPEEKPIIKEFLAEHDKDQRRNFIVRLLEDTKGPGVIIVYNKSFEITRLKELAILFPELSRKIYNRIDRIRDLLVPFMQRIYYSSQFNGSVSIKSVLPVLTKLDYSDLEIKNGAVAMQKYSCFDKMTLSEIASTSKALTLYCRRDVEAMVELHKSLKQIITK